ncbi:MAG: nitroreductase [Syntrophomonadaceae bacterium]
MNVIDALNSRFTCRAFRPDPVGKDTIIKILEAANRAPSWGNTQPWDIYVAAGTVLEDLRKEFLTNMAQKVAPKTDLPLPQEWPTVLQERYTSLGKERAGVLAEELGREHLSQAVAERNFRFFDAPVVFYICMDHSLTPYSMLDLGAVGQSIMLAAQEYDLATAPAVMLVAYPDPIHKALGIPEDKAIVLGIALGCADTSSIHNQYRSRRRPVEEMARLVGF